MTVAPDLRKASLFWFLSLLLGRGRYCTISEINRFPHCHSRHGHCEFRRVNRTSIFKTYSCSTKYIIISMKLLKALPSRTRGEEDCRPIFTTVSRRVAVVARVFVISLPAMESLSAITPSKKAKRKSRGSCLGLRRRGVVRCTVEFGGPGNRHRFESGRRTIYIYILYIPRA